MYRITFGSSTVCLVSNYPFSKFTKFIKKQVYKMTKEAIPMYYVTTSVIIRAHNYQLLDEVEQNIVIFQWRADQLFAEAEGWGT